MVLVFVYSREELSANLIANPYRISRFILGIIRLISEL